MEIEELLRRVQKGEDETLELKTTVPSVDLIAKILASLANTRGGLIVLGVAEPARFVGVDVDRAQTALRAAERQLSPAPSIEVNTLAVSGKTVVVATVAPSKVLISAHGGYFRRVGDATRALTAEEIKTHVLAESSSDNALAELSKAVATQTLTIEKQTLTIEKLRDDFNKANSTLRKIAIAVLGAIAGAFAKYLFDLWSSG